MVKLTYVYRPVVYPPVGRRKAVVPYQDLERLDEGEFLNDTLIEFYMLYATHLNSLDNSNITKLGLQPSQASSWPNTPLQFVLLCDSFDERVGNERRKLQQGREMGKG